MKISVMHLPDNHQNFSILALFMGKYSAFNTYFKTRNNADHLREHR